MPYLQVEEHSINLDREMSKLAMEASVLANVINTFRSILPSLSSKLSEIASNFRLNDDLSKDVNALVKFVDSHKDAISSVGIVKHSKTLLPVPEGFDSKAKMLDFLDCLLASSPVIMLGIQEILSEYHSVLSIFISNKDAKTAIRDHSAFYKRIGKTRQEVSTPLASYFDKGIDRSRMYFGDIYDQTSDIFEATKKANELNRLRSKHNLEAIRKQVNECAELLKLIVKQSEQEDFSEVSGPVALDLSNGAYEVGFWVELVSIYQYRIEQAIQAVKLQTEFVSKLH